MSLMNPLEVNNNLVRMFELNMNISSVLKFGHYLWDGFNSVCVYDDRVCVYDDHAKFGICSVDVSF